MKANRRHQFGQEHHARLPSPTWEEDRISPQYVCHRNRTDQRPGRESGVAASEALRGSPLLDHRADCGHRRVGRIERKCRVLSGLAFHCLRPTDSFTPSGCRSYYLSMTNAVTLERQLTCFPPALPPRKRPARRAGGSSASVRSDIARAGERKCPARASASAGS